MIRLLRWARNRIRDILMLFALYGTIYMIFYIWEHVQHPTMDKQDDGI